MLTSVLSVLGAALCTSSLAQGAIVCPASSYWPGWAGIKHAFVFGDSYSTTGFLTNATQPTRTSPLGNPTYPGYTASNGPNWVDYLTVKYNSSLVLTYNLAYGGATIDSTLVAPYEPQVSSVSEQFKNEWIPTYSHKNTSLAPWTSSDTLFAIFDGINDVGNSYSAEANPLILNLQIFSEYYSIVESLYTAGARNFAFLTVPPVDRSPLTSANGAATQAIEKTDIAAWNSALLNLTSALKTAKPNVNIFTVDSNKYFTQVLDDPASYPQTAGYKNMTAYCTAYMNGTPEINTFNSTCDVPVNEYFWLNSLHPTYPMHDVLAQQVAAQLTLGPNVC